MRLAEESNCFHPKCLFLSEFVISFVPYPSVFSHLLQGQFAGGAAAGGRWWRRRQVKHNRNVTMEEGMEGMLHPL